MPSGVVHENEVLPDKNEENEVEQVVTNSDKDISYFTTNQVPYYISETTPAVTLPCMEGQIVKCEGTTDNNVITISQISNNRFYLPEAQIAENGIFIYNVWSRFVGKEKIGK